MSSELTISGLTLDEVNKILGALGDKPYSEVFEIIPKIVSQVSSQVAGGAEIAVEE